MGVSASNASLKHTFIPNFQQVSAQDQENGTVEQDQPYDDTRNDSMPIKLNSRGPPTQMLLPGPGQAPAQAAVLLQSMNRSQLSGAIN
mgnify:CR=1 FL=1